MVGFNLKTSKCEGTIAMNSTNLSLGPFSPIIVIKEGVLLPGREYTFVVMGRY